MVRKFAAFLVLLLVLFIPEIAFGAEDVFSTSYDVLYDVDEAGVTTVTEKIALKNLTSEHYANQFKLTIGATEVFDIKAADPEGPLNVNNEKKDTATVLDVKFNQQVAGIGKTLLFTLSFKSKDFAEKSGKVWEIRSPRVSSSSNLENYNLTVSVPQSFGELSSVSPLPKKQSVSMGRIFLTFDRDQLQSSGVSATFGTNQLFDFDLIYHLENKNLMPVLTNIALPPDTSFQDVIFQRIEPRPINVTVDPDGNYLAWFKLNRNERIDVRVIGSAKLYTASKVKNPSLPDSLRSKYTSADKYWEKDNPVILAKLNEITGGDASLDEPEKIRQIYRYVVNNLKYDAQRITENIERFGAVTALNNPDQAVCMEFTDLFIALVRAAGIPARELDGYAHTSNTALRPLTLTRDILHAWPEYWDDRRGWVMVDPTWENTTGGVDYFNKFDLNHFVFAVKGSSSEMPVPAGSYKFSDEDSDDVRVVLSGNDFLGKAQIGTQIDVSNQIIAGFPASLKIKIINSGNGVFVSSPLGITAKNLIILDNPGRMTGLIPAYGEAVFEFNLRTRSLFESYQDEITVSAGGQEFTKQITVRPFILFQPVPLMISAGVVLMVVIYATVLGLHIYKGRFKDRKIGKK